jgi:hypothetical protein
MTKTRRFNFFALPGTSIAFTKAGYDEQTRPPIGAKDTREYGGKRAADKENAYRRAKASAQVSLPAHDVPFKIQRWQLP